jgi:hypothetical protein
LIILQNREHIWSIEFAKTMYERKPKFLLTKNRLLTDEFSRWVVEPLGCLGQGVEVEDDAVLTVSGVLFLSLLSKSCSFKSSRHCQYHTPFPFWKMLQGTTNLISYKFFTGQIIWRLDLAPPICVWCRAWVVFEFW